MVILPSDHRLAARNAISPQDLVGETFVTVRYGSCTAWGDRQLPEAVWNQITPAHEADHVTMAMSLIVSTAV